MPELRDDLRRYIDLLAERAETEIGDGVAPAAPTRRRRRTALVAAIGVVIAVSSGFLLSRGAGPTRSVRSGSARLGAPTLGGWQQLSKVRAGIADGAVVTDVTAGGPGFVAAGEAGLSRASPEVWTSADGVHWVPVPSRDLPRARADSLTLTESRHTLVAVLSRSQTTVGVWTSGDGRQWSDVGRDPFGTGAVINRVIGTPGGFVAVGATPIGPHSTRPAAWFSADGHRWSRATFSGDSAHLSGDLSRVTRVGSRYVAFGVAATANLPNSFVWTSSDGRTWHSGESPFPDPLVDAGAAPDGIVALTEPAQTLGGSLWITNDGQSWRPLPTYHQTFPSGSPDKVTHLDNWTVVAGSTPAADGNRTFGAWTSSDQQTWTAMPPELHGVNSGAPNSASGVHLAADQRRAVVFSASPVESAFWTWSPPQPSQNTTPSPPPTSNPEGRPRNGRPVVIQTDNGLTLTASSSSTNKVCLTLSLETTSGSTCGTPIRHTTPAGTIFWLNLAASAGHSAIAGATTHDVTAVQINVAGHEVARVPTATNDNYPDTRFFAGVLPAALNTIPGPNTNTATGDQLLILDRHGHVLKRYPA